jgi:hypothetical protein
MNIREIIAIRDRLKSELETTEKFLAIVRREEQDKEEQQRPPIRVTAPPAQRNLAAIVAQTNGDYGSIGKTVIESIKLCPTEFSVGNVFEAASKDVHHQITKLQISTALARLNRQGKIEMVRKKKGKSPALYRRM